MDYIIHGKRETRGGRREDIDTQNIVSHDRNAACSRYGVCGLDQENG